MRRVPRLRMVGCLLMLFVMATFAGCASLPEVGPFVDATAEMRSAVVVSGSTVVAELRLMPGGEVITTEQAQKWASDFGQKWETHAQAVDALVIYAESLHAIVKASQQGAQSARALADAVTGLAQGVGVVVPAAGAVPVVVDAATFVYSHIALIRASHSLEEALLNAQPAVRRIAMILAQNLKAADDILLTANTEIQQNLEINRQVEWSFRHGLLTEQRALYTKARSDRTAADEARLLTIDQLLTSTKVWYDPLQRDLEQTKQRLRAGRQLIAATIQIIEQWAIGHEQLVFAVRERRTLNPQALVQAAVDIRDLVRRIRAL